MEMGDIINIVSLGFNFITAGGVVTLFTLKAKKKLAEEEAEKVELSNADTIVKMQSEVIIEPMRQEIIMLRNEVVALKNTNIKQESNYNEMKKLVSMLTRAIEMINTCLYKADCPVEKTLKEKDF